MHSAAPCMDIDRISKWGVMKATVLKVKESGHEGTSN
jgi:hypothetical protein